MNVSGCGKPAPSQIPVRSSKALFYLIFGSCLLPQIVSAAITLTASNVQQNPPGPSATFTLNWNPPAYTGPLTGVRTYLFQSRPQLNGTASGPLQELIDSSIPGTIDGSLRPPLTLTRSEVGPWRYQIIWGWKTVHGTLQVLDQSNIVEVRVHMAPAPTPPAPSLSNLPRSAVTGHASRLQWSASAGAMIYELAISQNSGFASATTYWPTANFQLQTQVAGTYYARVRAWNQIPQNGGSASPWSNVINYKVLGDEEFLDEIGRKTFDYLVATTYPNGLTRDRLSTSGQPTPVASIAAGGFYLSALTVGAERGWITVAEARDRARTALQTYSTGTPTEHGFYYHFLNPDGSPSSTPFLEVSSLDTAILIAGALQAGEYFGGEVKTLADSIYRRVEWDWMLDSATVIMRQAWTQQEGFKGYYNSFSEANLLYLLAIGSPTHPIPPESFYSFARPKGNYGGPDFVFTAGGQIFIYQYPNAWYDFRNTTDYLGVNWWQNSIEGVRANHRWCSANGALGYDQYHWGLTACDGPDTTPENPYGYEAYGAKPSYFNTQDGTIAPTGIGGSVAIAPDLAIASLKHLYVARGDSIWKTYGFVDSFNPARNWVDGYYLAIDQGIMLLMIENRRSGMVWQKFMANEHVIRSLQRAGFSGYASTIPDVSLENFEDQNFWTPNSTLGWWESDGALVYQRSNELVNRAEGAVSMRLQYAKNNHPWSLTAGHLSTSNTKRNFSGHELLTLKVYGATDILLKLRDQGQAEQDVATRKTWNPNGWNTLTYDISEVAINLSAIDNILFFVAPGNSFASGTVLIDDIKLENRKPRKMEDFEDGNFWSPNTSLGWWDVDGTTIYRRSQSKDPSLGGLGAMKVEYNKNGLAWSYMGAHLSSSNPLRDFSKHTRLVIPIYGEAGVLVKLRDRALREVDIGTQTAANSNGWSHLVFDYSNITAIDLGDIENILIFVAPGNSTASGTIYLDDLVLE